MTGPTVDDLIDEIKRGNIYECDLHDPHWVVDGVTEGQRIYIDPRPSIIDTVLHECLHRLKPRWGERAVRQYTRKLLGSMDRATMRKVWRVYQRVVKHRRTLRLDE